MRKSLALWLYRCLLAFYPTGFRTEFEAEMKAVFTQVLEEQRASTVRLLWRELCDWPGLVWFAHHAERRNIMMPTNSSRVQPVPDRRLVPAGSWRDAWLAALGYLFYLWVGAGGALLSALSGLFHLTSETRGILGAGIGMAILVIDFIVVLLCWRGGWPRWSLPYLGIVLTWLVFFAQAMIRNDGSLLIFTPPLVFFIIFLLAALGWWWKGLHSLYERLNSDWTLIGLAYFSCGPFLFFILLNETRYEARGNLVLSVILALGVFAYMRSASLWQRMVVLPVIFTAACLVAAFYMQADYNGWLPYFRILISWDAVAIAPLLIIGILELGRYAFSRWLQAA